MTGIWVLFWAVMLAFVVVILGMVLLIRWTRKETEADRIYREERGKL